MTESKYAGMTVNERLYFAGLIDDFDCAAKARDKKKLIAILMQTDLTEKQATETTEALLAHPEKYGY